MKRTHSLSSSSSSPSCTESLDSSCPPPPPLPPPPPPPPNKPKRRARAKRILETNPPPLPPPLPPPHTLPPSATPTPSRRSSIYRGVTRHKCTGRFEAHLWDKDTWNTAQNKKGRQIYLGAYENEETAARTYDLAALKYWGSTTALNFPIENYTREIQDMEKMSKDEYLTTLRRKSSGFSRGLSKFRGVAKHHQNGRWEARIGRVNGNKYLYLGTFGSQEEAAEAYDLAAIEHKGPNAMTNFNISRYTDKLQQKNPPLSSSTEILQADETEHHQQQNAETVGSPQVIMDEELYRQQNAETYDSPEVMYEELQMLPIMIPRPCDHEHEHLWNLCLENRRIDFDSLPVSDNPKELHDLFVDNTFDNPKEIPNLFVDTPFDNPKEIPNLFVDTPFDNPKELPELFVDTTFEDELGFIFDYEAYDKDINQGDFLSLGSGSR